MSFLSFVNGVSVMPLIEKYDMCLTNMPHNICKLELKIELGVRANFYLNKASTPFNLAVRYLHGANQPVLVTHDTIAYVTRYAKNVDELVQSVMMELAMNVAFHPSTKYLSQLMYLRSSWVSALMITAFHPWRFPTVYKMWRYWSLVPREHKKYLGKYKKYIKRILLYVLSTSKKGVVARYKEEYKQRLIEKGHPKPNTASTFRVLKKLSKHYWVAYRVGFGLPLNLPTTNPEHLASWVPVTEKGYYLPDCGEYLGNARWRPHESCYNDVKLLEKAVSL